MNYASKAALLLGAAALTCASSAGAAPVSPDGNHGGTVPGWPSYVAMGAVGGPNISPPTATSTGGDDDFGGHPVDVVFKYAGANGNGDPGMIDPPTNDLRMTGDLTLVSGFNSRAARVAIVEYTAQMSGGVSVADFTNTSAADPGSGGNYLMARHLISLASDSMAMNDQPVVYNGKIYYGTLILNPDLMGAIQQGNSIASVNSTLADNPVNTAVDQALCFSTVKRRYHNTSNPNGLSSPPYLNKTYTGTPVSILERLLKDGYPVWSINSGGDPFWNTATDNYVTSDPQGDPPHDSTVAIWFNACVANPSYDTVKYAHPNFPNTFEGWVQANNWLIRTFSPKGHVTFGWQDNVWAAGTGFWLHNDLSDSAVASTYSTPVSNWLNTNAPSTVKTAALGANYAPDYFVFDRYENDDSAAPGQATLYSARSWDNYLTAVGQVSASFNNIPVMMWQIPGSHLPYDGEANPEYFPLTTDEYIFSTAPVYFFSDSHLNKKLSNLVSGKRSSTNANAAVGKFMLNCGSLAYNCPSGDDYREYLTYYKGQPNNYDWGKNNHRLALAASKHVFAILWGGGNTTNVIKNFSNPDDHGWLSSKIIDYYTKPTLLPKPAGGPVDGGED